MKCYFQPTSDGDGAERDDDDDSAPGLLGLPAALLERHGARVLDPGAPGRWAATRDHALRCTGQ
jgi:hypothetical protein